MEGTVSIIIYYSLYGNNIVYYMLSLIYFFGPKLLCVEPLWMTSTFTPSFSFCTVYLMMATSEPKHVVATY
jgi:hypothetical protein